MSRDAALASRAGSPRGGGPPRGIRVLSAGTVPYEAGLELQADLVDRRRVGAIEDTLILLEHPHVITLGSSSKREHVLWGTEERSRLGVELHETGRGGGVTYHGPGQLVVYPIVDLKPDRQDLHAYVRDLEAVLIDTCAAFGVEAHRREGLTGVWTPRGKLAAIGVRVSSQWITSHGVALNVSPDLRYFDSIVPCGIADAEITSLERELGGVGVDGASVADAFVRCFAAVFEREIIVG